MNGHHLILGTLVDFITGEIVDDTLDERYRQDLAHLLVEQKGYFKANIRSRQSIVVTAGQNRACLPLDFQVVVSSVIGMIIKYGPGSIVTRHRPALALSRLSAPYQIPVVVVTNGQTADILDGGTGKIISNGLESIPSKDRLREIVAEASLLAISKKRFDLESRILYAYEIDGACPCDDTICKL
ncbi:MAG: type I restriction enzyme HsdR N-terminal domain-containing protein [Pseudomonadota bacterium]